jgi:hypothetical protein
MVVLCEVLYMYHHVYAARITSHSLTFQHPRLLLLAIVPLGSSYKPVMHISFSFTCPRRRLCVDILEAIDGRRAD